MRGGSLYISLSSGWFSIKCHLLINIFLRLDTDGLYCVTKGINPFCTFCGLCWSADFLSEKFDFCEDFVYQIIWIASDTQVWSKNFNVFFKCCLWRVGSKKPKGFAFDKCFFHAWSVTGREMRVLKCLSRFKMRADVKDWILWLFFRAV